jgi:hypothetical protein
MIKEIKDIFSYTSGNTGITEEFIYSNLLKKGEKFEVLSSSTISETKLGILPIIIETSEISIFNDRLGILIARNGKAGSMTYLRKGKYLTNDHAYIIYLKNDFRRENNIDNDKKEEDFLKWFICKYQSLVYEFSSKTDNATWNMTAFFKYASISIDSYEIRKNYSKKYDEIQNILFKITDSKNHIDIILKKSYYFENEKELNNIPIGDVLEYVSRNDSLSEEGIYNFNPQSIDEKTVTVLSGSTDSIYFGEISTNTPKIHKLENRQGLMVVSRGKAGKLFYLKKGTYATNTNAFILYLKDDFKTNIEITTDLEEEIYLKLLLIYLEPIFINLSSSSDVSVFPLTKIFKNLEIPQFPMNKKYKDISLIYSQVMLIREYVDKIQNQLISLSEKTVVY